MKLSEAALQERVYHQLWVAWQGERTFMHYPLTSAELEWGERIVKVLQKAGYSAGVYSTGVVDQLEVEWEGLN